MAKTKYVAFLRGINVGGRTVKMDDLRAAFADMGLEDAQTLIASGNVLFQSDGPPDPTVIEEGLEKHFGFPVGVVVRSHDELERMIAESPFTAYAAGPDMKFYVTFAAGPIGDRMEGVQSVPGDFDIVEVRDKEIFAVAHRQPSGRFGAGLDANEKRFKDLTVTTRNFNTVERMAAKVAKA